MVVLEKKHKTEQEGLTTKTFFVIAVCDVIHGAVRFPIEPAVYVTGFLTLCAARRRE